MKIKQSHFSGKEDGREEGSEPHIAVYMSLSNLPRVTVGICNRPRGSHLLLIKSQWPNKKSLSQG